METSKVKDKNFKVIKYEQGRFAWLKRLIVIIVAAAAVVGISGYLLFSPRGSPPGVVGDAPEDMVRGYGTEVGRFIPPSGVFPTQPDVGRWLEFFDRPSQQWFRDNAPKLAYLNARGEDETWKGWNRARRESEAMVYLLAQAPFRGGVVEQVRVDEANNRAAIELRSRDQTHRFLLVRESGGWRFSDMMGQRERLQQTLAGVTLP